MNDWTNSTPKAADAVTQLFELHGDEIYRYARYALGDSQTAEDLVQDVFLRALRGWSNFRHESEPRTWLWTIARRLIQDEIRRRIRDRARRDPAELPVDRLISKPDDTLVELENDIASLTPSQRQVFILRIVQDLSVRDTANILGWSEIRVRTTLHRALQALKKRLSDDSNRAKKEGNPYGHPTV